MTPSDIKATIREFILTEFLPDEDPNDLEDSTPLLSSGVLDSIASVKLISFLEEEYDIEFEAHEMNTDNLNSVDALLQIVTAKLG